MDRNQIALQMWTVRDVMDQGTRTVYEKVAKMGYMGVEVGDFGGLSPEAFCDMLEDLGLAFVGRHVGIDALEEKLDETVEAQLALGGGNLIIAYLDKSRRETGAMWTDMSKKLAEFSDILAPKGITLGYHNHNFEFETFDGKTGYEILFDRATCGDLVAELDVYWATYGGHDPVEMIGKMVGRLPILHIKDMAPGEGREFTEVGEGIIDMKPIVAAGDRVGVEWFVVEQDTCKRPPLESVEISYRNLSRICG
jgi:sugar phosphate isomerase/epimerase